MMQILHAIVKLRFVFENLPRPKWVWLSAVCMVMPRLLFSLYGIIYVTWYGSHLPEPTRVLTTIAYGIYQLHVYHVYIPKPDRHAVFGT